MKKLLFFLLTMLLFCACQESIEDRAERDAREATTKRCPLRMSKDIVLERIDFDKATRTWQQTHLWDIDTTIVLSEEAIKEVLLTELLNAPSYKAYRDAGFNFKYIYCRMTNPKDTVINMTLTSKDYNR